MRCLRKGRAVGTTVYTSLVLMKKKLPQYLMLVIEDVTDRIQAEHAFRDTERRLALAQGAAQLGVWN